VSSVLERPPAPLAPAPAPPTVRAPAPEPPRIRPRTFHGSDYGVLFGTALSALSLMWVAYYRVLPLTGPVGYVLLSYAVFVIMYYAVVRQVHGRVLAFDRLMTVVVATGALALFIPLLLIITYVFTKGVKALSLNFFTETLEFVGPLDPASEGGGAHAIVGTLEQVAVAVVISVPLGIATAVFLNEIGGRLARPVRFIVDAMSGVPSIVAGLFIYALWVGRDGGLGMGFSGFAAGLALSILMLPSVTRTSEEVLRLVPDGLREASLALGASEYRTTTGVVLPTARGGLITASVLGMARAVGETAPLIMTSFGSSFMHLNVFEGDQASLPLFSYRLISSPEAVQQARAWTGALVLIVMVLVLFTIARIAGSPKRMSRRVGAATPKQSGRARRKAATAAAHEAAQHALQARAEQGAPPAEAEGAVQPEQGGGTALAAPPEPKQSRRNRRKAAAAAAREAAQEAVRQQDVQRLQEGESQTETKGEHRGADEQPPAQPKQSGRARRRAAAAAAREAAQEAQRQRTEQREREGEHPPEGRKSPDEEGGPSQEDQSDPEQQGP
jgi:phosphate transport system permease protein